MFNVSVELQDETEFGAWAEFIVAMIARRSDPFAITPEVKEKTEAAMRFDELVPADDPPEATTNGPTWAPNKPTMDRLTASIERAGGEMYPTEDDAVAAFKKFAATHKAEESVALVKSFNVARVKELPADKRAAFIAEASRDS